MNPRRKDILKLIVNMGDLNLYSNTEILNSYTEFIRHF